MRHTSQPMPNPARKEPASTQLLWGGGTPLLTQRHKTIDHHLDAERQGISHFT